MLRFDFLCRDPFRNHKFHLGLRVVFCAQHIRPLIFAGPEGPLISLLNRRFETCTGYFSSGYFAGNDDEGSHTIARVNQLHPRDSLNQPLVARAFQAGNRPQSNPAYRQQNEKPGYIPRSRDAQPKDPPSCTSHWHSKPPLPFACRVKERTRDPEYRPT